ncbi:DHH family phosphoesterase [Planctomicrobium sp. SH664]|uniref:DHH family phosphoesterase n=1 Tax=Planctomicrobium sp. SH664 TaxID=3448125 RepID=UPI003F5C4D5F
MNIDWQPLREIIDRSQRFIISSHVRPDADAIGSEIGLAGWLLHLGKQVRIVNPSATPEHLRFLDPDHLVQKIGGEVSIDSVCDTDVHVIVDTSAWQQLVDVGKALEKSTATKVVIDHHVSSDSLGALEFKDVSASATGVLITELIEACGGSFHGGMPNALFAAIATDTGWFRFPNSDARTMRTAARLIDQGVQPHLVYRELYERSSLAKLRLQGVVLGRVGLVCQGRLAHTLITREDFRMTGALPTDTDELVNAGLTIEGVEASFILVEQADGRIKASLRSRSTLDVAAIAENFGGGGHRQAAGAMLPGPILEAQKTLLTAFEKVLGCGI